MWWTKDDTNGHAWTSNMCQQLLKE